MAAVGYTPEQLAEIGKQLGSTYRDGEARILRILARGDITSWKRAFKEQQLAQIRQVLDQLVDQQEFGQRGDIETRAGLVERPQDLGRGVGLHRIIGLNAG